MTERLSTLELRRRLGDVLNRVSLRHDEFIIERKGQPLAAMVPVEKLLRFQQMARLELQGAMAGSGSTLTERGADTLADEAKHKTRKRNDSTLTARPRRHRARVLTYLRELDAEFGPPDAHAKAEATQWLVRVPRLFRR